ncbi:indole acetimide hydrolase [Xenorhabdus sp. ZM]|nr:indole acetimide hydrolase [Xenorhabdus sp. ZM]
MTMPIDPYISLATEVAINRCRSGLRNNHRRRLANYHHTKHQNAFIAFDEMQLSGEMPIHCPMDVPLFGLPFSCKDNINAQGFTTTAGTSGLKDFMPENDAPIVARLRELGAVLIGKNNMHELSFGVTSHNEYWGVVDNPIHSGHIAGGSSGGSAAAVAAGVSAFAVGTDTGGSVRIPASLCGVSGFRPSTGRYPRSGIVPISHTKDTPGFIAPTVIDIAMLDAALTGETPIAPVMPSRIGIPARFLWQELDASVEQACNQVLSLLESNGITLIRFDDSLWGELNAAIQFSVPFYEFFIDFPRFLLSHGMAARFHSILDQLCDHQVRNIIQNQLQYGSISWDDYMIGLRTMDVLRKAWSQGFLEHHLDAILYPTVNCPVPCHEKAHESTLFEHLVRNTDIASSVGAPSLTIPVGLKEGLSVGLSIDGLPGQDRRLLSHAQGIASLLS